VEAVIVDKVEIAKQVEPEDVTKLLQSHDETLMAE
jgi:hypothetical protein